MACYLVAGYGAAFGSTLVGEVGAEVSAFDWLLGREEMPGMVEVRSAFDNKWKTGWKSRDLMFCT